MFGAKRYRGPGAAPPKGNWPVGEMMTKENFVATAYAVIQEMIGEREKTVAMKEARIGEMERICRICLAVIEDQNPRLYRSLRKEFDAVYK